MVDERRWGRVELESVAAIRVAEISARVPSMSNEHIGPLIGPLFARLFDALVDAGTSPLGSAIAYYDEVEHGHAIVHAAFPIGPAAVTGTEDWRSVDLPAIEAATVIHHGSMAGIDAAWARLDAEVGAHPDLRMSGAPREVYLHTSATEDQSDWVTELQQPVERG